MTTPPNILIIIADSARADAYEHSGVTVGGSEGDLDWVRTPVTYQLSLDGLTFTRAYTPTGLCHPARACLDSGLHAHANGQLVNTVWDKPNLFGLRPDAPSYLRLLQAAGYRVGYTGQRHLRQSVFDDVAPGAVTAFKAAGLREGVRDDRPQRKPFFGELDLPVEQHRDAFTVRGAQELLRRYAAQDRPWLIQCEFDGPHPPFYLPREYATLYDPEQVPEPASFEDDGQGKQSIHRRVRPQQMPEPWGENWRRLVAHYGGYVTMLDRFTGEILAELDRLGMAGNTLVVVTSDHGELVGAHGTVTKYPQMYDEVMRVPLRARWPGRIPLGTTEDSFVSHVDLLPTLAEIAGAPSPEGLHGQSWAALTRGETLTQPRSCIYGQLHGWGSASWYSLRMVRNERWKYVYSPYAEDELYDLASDPKEVTSVASAMPDQVAAMRRLLAQQMREVDDPLASHADFKSHT
jgi:arylsulfatase A-like enzyme